VINLVRMTQRKTPATLPFGAHLSALKEAHPNMYIAACKALEQHGDSYLTAARRSKKALTFTISSFRSLPYDVMPEGSGCAEDDAYERFFGSLLSSSNKLLNYHKESFSVALSKVFDDYVTFLVANHSHIPTKFNDWFASDVGLVPSEGSIANLIEIAQHNQLDALSTASIIQDYCKAGKALFSVAHDGLDLEYTSSVLADFVRYHATPKLLNFIEREVVPIFADTLCLGDKALEIFNSNVHEPLFSTHDALTPEFRRAMDYSFKRWGDFWPIGAIFSCKSCFSETVAASSNLPSLASKLPWTTWSSKFPNTTADLKGYLLAKAEDHYSIHMPSNFENFQADMLRASIPSTTPRLRQNTSKPRPL
jgi:hypothetical protein